MAKTGSGEGAAVAAEATLPNWATLPADDVLGRLGSTEAGLTAAEAAERLARHGPNRLPPPRRRGPLSRLGSQVHNVLIYVLLAAAVVTAVLAHWIDTAVIVGVVVVNVAIGCIQEGKAERAIEAVGRMLSTQAMVHRDGQRRVIPAEDLVPGDIVFLQSGDKVPADLRLIAAKNLRIQEAALTGESVAVEKSAQPVPPGTPLAERASMAFSGTIVAYGQGTGVTIATGPATEVGRINQLLAEVEALATPLLRQIGAFGRLLTVGILALAALTFAFGVLARGFPVDEMFMAVVGLAVAAIPEGLPAMITIALAIGVRRMAGRRAIIRRLPAVETLGSVTVICSDKTGTLTVNELTARRLATLGATLDASGSGYDPRGGFSRDGREVALADYPDALAALRAGALCNDARLERTDTGWRAHGDPMEGALLAAAIKGGLDPVFEAETFRRTDVIPFEAEHRLMATLHHNHDGHGWIYVKGAPERLIELCGAERHQGEDRPIDRARWMGLVDDLTGRGQRVLAVAMKRVGIGRCELTFDDLDRGLALVALFGFIDPPRAEAVAAANQCRSAGIVVKMITGDHARTAAAVAREIGIANWSAVLTGPDVDRMDDDALRRAVAASDVFARTTPEHKLRLVTALQAHGHTVAMTGDGVNDAPALKRADIGVAMGIQGTEAAKEAAEMVLADDNFASIVNAVHEGRTVYDNLKKTIAFNLPMSGGQALTIVAAVLSGLTLPVTPVQILWVNLISAVTLGLALVFEPPEPDAMRRPPRAPGERILSGFLVWRIAFVSALMLAATFGLFLAEAETGAPIAKARTIAVNTLVFASVGYLFSARFLIASSASREGLCGSRPVLLAVGLVSAFQVLFTYAPLAQRLFGTVGLDAHDWMLILAAMLATFALVELEKAVLRLMQARARLAQGKREE